MEEQKPVLPEITKPIIFVGLPNHPKSKEIVNKFNEDVKDEFEVVVLTPELYDNYITYLNQLRGDFSTNLAIAKERVTQENKPYFDAAIMAKDALTRYFNHNPKGIKRSGYLDEFKSYELKAAYKDQGKHLPNSEVEELLKAFELYRFVKRVDDHKTWRFTMTFKEEIAYWQEQIALLEDMAKKAISSNKIKIRKYKENIISLKSQLKSGKKQVVDSVSSVITEPESETENDEQSDKSEQRNITETTEPQSNNNTGQATANV
jgi:hypothetical protein